MIAFVINELDIRGGTHKQFLKLVEYTYSQNIDFIIVTTKLDLEKTYPGFRRFESMIKVIPSPQAYSNGWGKVKTYFKPQEDLRKALEGINKVNIHDNGFELILSTLYEKDVYWQINDLPFSFIQMYNTGGLSLLSKLKQYFVRKKILSNLKYVKQITVNVSKNRERIKESFKRDSSVFYCGIDPLHIKRTNNNTFERFANKKINLLSSGVFFPYRNYETQISVIEELILKGYDVHLNIIGATDRHPHYANKIKDLIKEKKLESRITICGQVDESQFNELHINADIFLFINVDQSWGLAVFEAMSCGIPVIVSESVGATEILSDGENAIFVNPFDVEQISNKIIGLSLDNTFYQKLSDKSCQIVDKYTWDKAYSSRMLDLILE